MKKGVVALLATIGIALSIHLVNSWQNTARKPVGVPVFELPELDVFDGEKKPVQGTLAGHAESKILERFGPPSDRWDGHFGCPPYDYSRQYPDAVTAVYIRPSGTLYLSFCQQEGRSVCFSSCWLPKGWAF